MKTSAPKSAEDRSETQDLISKVMGLYGKADAKRSEHLSDWEKLARFISPSSFPKDWRTGDDPLSHKLVDTTAVSANLRLSNILTQYIFPSQSPFLYPVLNGRDPNYDERVWLDHVQDALHHWYTHRSKSFQRSKPEIIKEICAFGTGASHCWAPAYGLPEYKAISIFHARFLTNKNGDLSHFFYRTEMTSMEIQDEFGRAPESDQPDKKFKVTYACIPGSNRNMRYREVVIAHEDQMILKDAGHEDMPFYAPSFVRRPEDHYGTGPGHMAYPFAEWLNRIQEASAAGAEKSVDPPVFDFTGGAFKKFDRRAGAVNSGDFSVLGFNDIRDALQAWNPTGDLRPGVEMIRDARNSIWLTFFVDWLEGTDQGVRTATEVADRRSLRIQSMASLVSNVVPEWVVPMNERTFRLLMKADYFDPMPESLRDAELSFEYRSPLASMMDQVESDQILAYLQKVAVMAQIDGTVMDNVDMDRANFRIHKNDGVPADILRDPEAVAELRQQRQQAAQQQAEQEAMAAQAAALRDGAQGAASLAGAQSDG